MNNFKLSILLVILLQACGGGQNTAESLIDGGIVNGVKVPAAPDVSVNSSTRQGVDSDGNGIRDDIDRKIAELFGGTADFSLAVDHAKSLQAAIVKGSSGDAEKYLSIINCSDLSILSKLRIVTIETLNSFDRRNAYAEVFAGKSISKNGCGND